ncbi:MAG: signal peptide peptidase SppA [Gammaproteobacteria bacterium]|nr:signal peptide peptidase SppA [Gammaproteobacteria bacterium]
MTPVVRFFKFVWRALDATRKVLHLILLLFLFLLIFAVVSPKVPPIPQKAALVIAPQGVLVEQLAGDPLERAVAELYGQERPETLLRDIVEAIEAAKTDDRIQVLVLDLSGLAGGGLAKLEEVAAAIRDFKTSGKKVISYGEAFDQSQYYIAANADEIYLDPQGVLLIQGYGHYRMFLKGIIDKLAIDVNVFRAGEFKSFTEQFTRTDMSDEEREATLSWLNALWEQYQAGIGRSRGAEEETPIEAYVNDFVAHVRAHRGDLAAVALERGLITGLKTRREVEEQLKSLVGEDERRHTYNHVLHTHYIATHRALRPLKRKDRVGVVVLSGEILDGSHPPGTIGSDSAVRLLRNALDDERVKAVVLRIDSPGGSMFASEVIRREIAALKAAGKPVIASMSSVAASGGYYIAMDADEIWASPATLTGSIGVFGIFPTIERSLEKIGITVDGVGTTPLADALRIDRTLKQEPREVLQLAVEHAYRVFVDHVARARGKSFQEIDAVAQGRVWAGVDAVERGLVDELGSYKDAIAAAARRAGLKEGEYDVEYIEPPLGWRQALALQIQTLAARFTKSLVPSDMLAMRARKALAPLERELTRLARLADPKQLYYYCPCQVE